MPNTSEGGSARCPVCGLGFLQSIAYRVSEEELVDPDAMGVAQAPETQQVETYSCGHEVMGPRLDQTSEAEGMEVEHRGSEETTEPF